MKTICIIPARMGSSRFPGKPLKKIHNMPMIEHVYKRAELSQSIDLLTVATPDKEIYNFVKSFGGNSILTSIKHERASDRCAEALLKLEELNQVKFDIVVMVQGDEPLVHPQMIEKGIEAIKLDKKVKVVNLLGKIDKQEFHNKNIIKVLIDKNKDAIYFSRNAIPFMKVDDFSIVGKQICIIPFDRNFLIQYSELTPTPLEIKESIDMLRVLEHGYDVRMVPINYVSHPVDVKEDVESVEKLLKNDDIYLQGY